MKINKIIISTNDDPKYYAFLPYVSEAWYKLLNNVQVIVGYASDKINLDMQKDADIHLFNYPDIPSANIAKISRLLLACRYPEDYCLLSDMDMLPIKGDYYINNSKALDDDKLLFFSSDAYPWQEMRYPICYILGKGEVFKELVNPDNLPETDLVQKWNTENPGTKSNLQSKNFSDESLLRGLILKWKNRRIQELKRGWINNIAINRIDRAYFSYSLPKLSRGDYIDCHMPRPLNIDAMKPIFEYLCLKY